MEADFQSSDVEIKNVLVCFALFTLTAIFVGYNFARLTDMIRNLSPKVAVIDIVRNE